ncbi:RWD domain-containing protein 3 [Erpetoichthys calabaricus]|uniref:RWD domain-containing protein 3 n=1 Tax=Erpetoichthys calabaricus TaxID=27687 RepID=A0A8C4SS30_ERPCA|nr:RWD domain-containing protein 3 [Erpetoichthys calabaricus]
MAEAVAEEISALSAIYCDKDEFELLETSDTVGAIFRIQIAVDGGSERILLKLQFHLPIEYPSCLPDISVSCERLTRKQCLAIKHALLEKATLLISGPMVHELIVWLQHNFTAINEKSANPRTPDCQSEQGGHAELWTALLLLDHMRAKSKYMKTIEKWTSDLGLTGRLFMGKWILILLQGRKRNIKDYVILQKTSKVDVDSSGKKCKEKMMQVLREIQMPSSYQQIPTFEIKDYSSQEDLKKEFELAGLSELYLELVHMLV